MNQAVKEYIHDLFEKLMDDYCFIIKTELHDNQSYMIDFTSKTITIRIEQYYRELYTSLYQTSKPNFQVNIFNLLDYLMPDKKKVPQGEYFHNEKNLDECFKKQLNHIFITIYENYNLISDFFIADDYEARITEFDKYWANKHPELYKKF